jgi:2-oxoglutarate/2-oxoacid ferredoxin oxidoreductase subunit alpha
MSLWIMDGNEAIARAAVMSGCRFFAGYPITPATTVLNTMLALLPPAGGVCLQGEDEIASIGFCLGAAMTGLKVMTATSGPGISLYSEQISFAIGSQIPIVIVDVQRLGPSTGSATKGADGDIQFLRWGNSGGVPVIVLAPCDVPDCYALTMHAFNLAETYRCPVFIATNKEIAMTRETLDLEALRLPSVISRRQVAPDSTALPYELEPGHPVPAFTPIGGERLMRVTSSTHGEDAYITGDPALIASMQTRLYHKLETAVEQFTFFELESPPSADTLVITYGITARAARTAVKAACQAGRPTALLVLKTLWPVPEQAIRAAAESFRHIAVIEMNLGQYVREIQRLLPNKAIRFLGQMNGELISPDKILEVIRHE